ncbi:MAG: hypothetical protein L7V86_22510 [Verrucomicrobiales bacterium]|jgi:predicted Rossmann-fold nucleotide-binding protein|nr:hypothetical protein [Verrucomicrobiales bacterium]MDC0312705.1 hypothetical protein [Verrucomicrobiales bacterium]
MALKDSAIPGLLSSPTTAPGLTAYSGRHTLGQMKELHSVDEILKHLQETAHLEGVVFQGVSLTEIESQLSNVTLDESIFLGCAMTPAFALDVQRRGGIVFPHLKDRPYHAFRPHLYTPEELFAGFDRHDPCTYCQTPDATIHLHWQETGQVAPKHVLDGILRRAHDQSITDALTEYLESINRKVVAIMGGHSMLRTDPRYREVAQIARSLTQKGYLLVSGGGPGAMEATHLGAWFAERPNSDLEDALSILAKAPSYRDLEWLTSAFEVRERYPWTSEACDSLGIPTWLYGHEPPTPFATHIAKYFANSLREEGLITIAVHGIIFSPGSAGTIQEIFQDVTQNHYATLGIVSPMVFLDKIFWTETKPIYPLLQSLAEGHLYGKLLGLADTVEETIHLIETLPPEKPEQSPNWHFCRAHCGMRD